MEVSPWFRSFVLGIFTSRINHPIELINAVAFNKLDARLAGGPGELEPVLHMIHQELANEIGSVPEMESRIFE